MNKDFLIDGREYISASRASKKVGYSSDYIGQLCRGEKIPGRLMGRTWYVDLISLQEHKKGAKLKKNKKGDVSIGSAIVKTDPKTLPELQIINDEVPKPVVEKIVSPVQPITSYYTPLRYEHEEGLPLSPQLGNVVTKSATISHRERHTMQYAMLSSLLVVTVLIGYLSTNLNNLQATNFQSQLGALSFNSEFLSSISNRVVLGINKIFNNGITETKEPETQYGIVALPDEKDHAGLVARVKRAFSDEIKVTVDPEGDSGVITPVFKDGDDTESYAFVMVPIKQQ